jgi:hypothetical protein
MTPSGDRAWPNRGAEGALEPLPVGADRPDWLG